MDLLKAPHIGVRELKNHLSQMLKKRGSLVVTDHGRPVNVILPYDEMLDLLDLLEEVYDPAVLEAVREGRAAVGKGSQGVPVRKLFDKIRKSRKR